MEWTVDFGMWVVRKGAWRGGWGRVSVYITWQRVSLAPDALYLLTCTVNSLFKVRSITFFDTVIII